MPLLIVGFGVFHGITLTVGTLGFLLDGDFRVLLRERGSLSYVSVHHAASSVHVGNTMAGRQYADILETLLGILPFDIRHQSLHQDKFGRGVAGADQLRDNVALDTGRSIFPLHCSAVQMADKKSQLQGHEERIEQ